MALHFEKSEYTARIGKVCEAMAADGLDGMLMFQQESMYYLTGYDSFGFCFFQCLYLGSDGRLALLTRSACWPTAWTAAGCWRSGSPFSSWPTCCLRFHRPGPWWSPELDFGVCTWPRRRDFCPPRSRMPRLRTCEGVHSGCSTWCKG